jgi:hypothetical protein
MKAWIPEPVGLIYAVAGAGLWITAETVMKSYPGLPPYGAAMELLAKPLFYIGLGIVLAGYVDRLIAWRRSKRV